MRLQAYSSAIIPIFAFPKWQYNNITEVLLYPSIFNDMFVKEYTTALIKQQWGQNLIKFEA